VVPPPGLEGGGAGATGRTRIIRADGRVETLASADRRLVGTGDVFCLETPGGGGYGPV
jgi:5-oxoprolinase (ATP-hydrolysing)